MSSLEQKLTRLKDLNQVMNQLCAPVDEIAACSFKFDVRGLGTQPKKDTSNFPSVLSGLWI